MLLCTISPRLVVVGHRLFPKPHHADVSRRSRAPSRWTPSPGASTSRKRRSRPLAPASSRKRSFALSDYLSIQRVLSDRTRGIFGAEDPLHPVHDQEP